MREADFGCARYSTCYDPTPADWGMGSGLELLIVLLIVALIVGLIWAANQGGSDNRTLLEEVDRAVNNGQEEARNWDNPEAAALIERVGDKIKKEIRERGIRV